MLGPFAAILTAIMIVVAVTLSLRRRVIVYAWETALLYRGGVFERTLDPGTHHYADLRQRVRIVRLPAHAQRSNFGPLDVLSADRFAFRLHLSVTWTIVDPRTAWEAQEVPESTSYTVAPLQERVAAAALAATGALQLDDLLGAPVALGDAVRAILATGATSFAFEAVAVTRMELPPETRRMLTEVERARRSGLAALERARSEQAALRSLANAARLVRDNPELAQLRLLQTIEDAKGPTTIVVGDPRAVPPS
ncbi:SPFH domain-containing protein [Sphingomonas guangdongensis]|uniref:SPFH domain-containing protein n=1 Tax=Sphingomonas guangdongensis TaxID=1141890 RepID=UPI001FE9C50F|nr:SPFH domain-containing protein [Sphingomonas guangdongensis]